jgi:hypothetical protein
MKSGLGFIGKLEFSKHCIPMRIAKENLPLKFLKDDGPERWLFAGRPAVGLGTPNQQPFRCALRAHRLENQTDNKSV